jgi:hypothetical protein
MPSYREKWDKPAIQAKIKNIVKAKKEAPAIVRQEP